MVVFDSSILLLVLDPSAKAPVDLNTGNLVEGSAERIEYLIANLGLRLGHMSTIHHGETLLRADPLHVCVQSLAQPLLRLSSLHGKSLLSGETALRSRGL